MISCHEKFGFHEIVSNKMEKFRKIKVSKNFVARSPADMAYRVSVQLPSTNNCCEKLFLISALLNSEKTVS